MDNPSQYVPQGRHTDLLPFIAPEERAQTEARQLEEKGSSSSGDYDWQVICDTNGSSDSAVTQATGTLVDIASSYNSEVAPDSLTSSFITDFAGLSVSDDLVAPSEAEFIAQSEDGLATPQSELDVVAAPTESESDIFAGFTQVELDLIAIYAQPTPDLIFTFDDIPEIPRQLCSRFKVEEPASTPLKRKVKETAETADAMSDIDATSATSAAGDQANPAAALGDKNTVGLKKVKKQKVLLMGKSGSGKSSMRSIIFSNYLARDTRRLGATIDIDLSHVKFLGNLTLNLWDCGGQEAFMENYLSQQRAHVFSNVGVLIYVFDIESRDVDRDLATYVNIASALFQYSREAKVFVLLHKMDLIQPSTREAVFDNRVTVIRKKTAEAIAIVRKQKPDMAAGASALAAVDLEMQAFATSIWDQSLYKAWASIIHDLVPNLSLIEQQLASLGVAIDAEEILLFERTSFLVVSKWSSTEGERNPFGDRFERLSNILKSWKHTCSKFTGTPRNAEQFTDFEYKAGANFALFITKFTTNTYILVCMPPGEARFNSAKLNVSIARSWFRFLDGPPTATVAASPASSGNSQQIAAGAAAGASGAAADYNAAGPSSEA